MPRENVDVVRSFYAAANEGDVENVLAGFHEDVEFDWTNSISPYSGRYRGTGGILQWLHEARDAFAEFSFEPEEFIDHPESHQVVVVLRIRGRGHRTGAMELTAVGAQVWTFEEGRPRLMRMYQSREEALEALG